MNSWHAADPIDGSPHGVLAFARDVAAAALSDAIEPLDTTAEVETPEQVRFRHQLAGPARRAAAYLVDLIVRGTIVFVFGFAAVLGGLVSTHGVAGVGTGLLLLLLFLVEWGYYVVCESLMSGRSVGKRAFGLRVVKIGGHPLGFGDSVLRNLLRAADALPSFYAIGVVVMAKDPLFRRLGDMVAGTVVVSEEKQRILAALRIEPPPTPKELERIPEKLAISPGEIEAIEQFLRRLGQLSPARELELAEIAAPIFARRMGLRYRDPARFLALLYYRATQRRG